MAGQDHCSAASEDWIFAILVGGAGVDTLHVVASYGTAFYDVRLDRRPDSHATPFPSVNMFGTDLGNVTFDTSASGASISLACTAADNVVTLQNLVDGSATVHGDAGNDRLDATASDAHVTLDGGDGAETLFGGNAGYGYNGERVFRGGPGTDVVDYGRETAGVVVHLDGSAKSGTAQTADGFGDVFDGTVEQVYGSDFADVLFGNGGDDVTITMGGTDAAFGGNGNDTVYADDGGSTYADGFGDADTAYIDPTGDSTPNVETVVKRKNGVVLGTPTRLAGTTYGTPGSYENNGNTVAKATDGNLSTDFDAPTASGAAIGVDLGAAKAVSQFAFAPRSGYASRMVGGVFQASNNVNFTSGVVTVYTVTTAPASGSLTTVNTNTATAYRYWRYVGPANGYGNVAEFQLFA